MEYARGLLLQSAPPRVHVSTSPRLTLSRHVIPPLHRQTETVSSFNSVQAILRHDPPVFAQTTSSSRPIISIPPLHFPHPCPINTFPFSTLPCLFAIRRQPLKLLVNSNPIPKFPHYPTILGVDTLSTARLTTIPFLTQSNYSLQYHSGTGDHFLTINAYVFIARQLVQYFFSVIIP